MKFPEYSAKNYPAPPTSVVQGYVRFFGGFERDNREQIATLARTDMQQVAMRVGRGCLIAADGNDRAADRIFKRAQRDLEPKVATPKQRRTAAGRHAAQLFATAQMLEYRYDNTATAEARQAMHLTTTREIGQLRSMFTRTGEHALTPEQRGNARGKLVERVGLGLLTRFSAHPWIMGMPALQHHDQGNLQRDNFDLLLVETSPSVDLTVTHKVQAKAECIGVCNDPHARSKVLSKYSPDIVFLSGCCDLGIRDVQDESELRLADLLIREADNHVTPEEITELDFASNSLLLSLTSGLPNRMGTYGLTLAA